MKLRVLIVALLWVDFVAAQGLTRREIFSNSAVHLATTCNNSMGSGFILVRPDPSKEGQPSTTGTVFLTTNKHVLPPQGKECSLVVRISISVNDEPVLDSLEIPVVGADGKYVETVKLHKNNDVAIIHITREIAESKVRPNFVFTTMLGTKDKLKKGRTALVGDEIYVLGYPAGLFDKRNAFPIWRIGIIATSPLLGYAFPDAVQKAFKLPSFLDGFLIDADIYPGSSGSAVVVKPQPISFDNPGTVSAGGARAVTYVLGIVSGSVPTLDFGGKVLSRMGLGGVESADAINDTIEMFFQK